MKISWLSNAPWANTGYGNQTRLFTPRLQAKGHNLAITAFYGLEAAVLHWNGIPVYPRGYQPYGQDIAGANAAHFKADVMISLMDAWVCEPQNYPKHIPWLAWFPVDSEPLPPPVAEKVKEASARIVFSHFGERMLDDAGLDYHYVPHGVDTNIYHPLDMTAARTTLGWAQDRFIVGMVAANKGNPPRKAWNAQLRAFAEFSKRHPDAMLYLHTNKSDHGEMGGVNLPEYIEFLGMEIGKQVMFCDQYGLLVGLPDEYMATAYSAMDVHMLVSMGEGFGIPILEAQACGTPVIVGDWTSMSELCFSGWKVSKDDADGWWTPLAAYQYQPRVGAIVDALEAAYRMKGNQDYRKRARKGALPYDADKVTDKYWLPVLNRIAEGLNDGQPAQTTD